MSSVGLKVIAREILENLLFLENLFLTQEFRIRASHNPRFAQRMLSWINRLNWAANTLPDKWLWLSCHYGWMCLTTQPIEWLTMDNLGGERKRELAMSGNSKPDETWLRAHTVDYTVSSLLYNVLKFTEYTEFSTFLTIQHMLARQHTVTVVAYCILLLLTNSIKHSRATKELFGGILRSGSGSRQFSIRSLWLAGTLAPNPTALS